MINQKIINTPGLAEQDATIICISQVAQTANASLPGISWPMSTCHTAALKLTLDLPPLYTRVKKEVAVIAFTTW